MIQYARTDGARTEIHIETVESSRRSRISVDEREKKQLVASTVNEGSVNKLYAYNYYDLCI